jgi:hypothetical protein
MDNFCTLFDANYLSRGLALYTSLKKVSPAFHLYVVAFDGKSYNYLSAIGSPNLTVISLSEFEDDELLKVKPGRTRCEYCWTCTPSVILYCLEKFNLPSCTYVDADMVFYDNPRLLLNEMGSRSVLISEHRYTKEYNLLADHGIYCVQFMCFKNNKQGLAVLKWWRDQCIEWCYNRLEGGKFGDQKYLDDWPQRFEGVHVLQHLGGGVAPWNLQQYEFKNRGEKIHLKNKKDNKSYPVVFFHFHGLKFYSGNVVSFCGKIYEISTSVKEIFYIPYIRKLLQIQDKLQEHSVLLNAGITKALAPNRRKFYFDYLRNLVYTVLKGKSPFRSRNYNLKMHYHFHKLDSLK